MKMIRIKVLLIKDKELEIKRGRDLMIGKKKLLYWKKQMRLD